MITVLISTYNHAHYLPIQLTSIIRQGDYISKIIVVNDGSTDDTANFLAEFQTKESRLMVINLAANIGYLQASCIGFSYVDTEFFAFAAADDILMPNWAEKSLNALRCEPNVGLCLSRTFVASETSHLINKTSFPKSLCKNILLPGDFRQSLLKYGKWFSSNTVLYRRKLFDQIVFQFASAGPFSDSLSIFFLGLRSGVVVVDEPLGVFFNRDSSMSGGLTNPSVGLNNVLSISAILLESPCINVIDRQLAGRILRRTTYIYIITAAYSIMSKFSHLDETVLPKTASTALSISLYLVLLVHKLVAFVILRPFDLVNFGISYFHESTAEEMHAIKVYSKALAAEKKTCSIDKPVKPS